MSDKGRNETKVAIIYFISCIIIFTVISLFIAGFDNKSVVEDECPCPSAEFLGSDVECLNSFGELENE